MGEGDCPLARRFLALTRLQPQAPALLDGAGETVATRAALAARAAAFADAVEYRRGAVAVLSLPNSADLIAAFLALRLAGRTVALVDAAAPAAELERCAAAVGAGLVLAEPERAGEAARRLARNGPAMARREGGAAAVPAGAALLKLTSGSTGTPRALAHSARQLAADTVQIMRTMRVRAGDVTLAAIPLTHSYGIGSCLVPLLLAGTPLVLPSATLPAALAAALAGASVAHFPAVPAMIRALGTLPGLPRLSGLRVCLSAGAPLAPRDAAAFHAATGVKVHVFYGCSECGGITYDRTESPVHLEGAVGSAMDRVAVEVVDEAGAALPSGTEGRVRVRSRAVALAAVPGSEDPRVLSPGVFLTSDLGVLDEHGTLSLTGRVAELLNVAGRKVHPAEVRAALEAIAGVRAAHVLGLPDPRRGELIAALVAVDPAAGLTPAQITAACRARLAAHKVPRRVVLVDELPLTSRGKLDREHVLTLLRRPASA